MKIAQWLNTARIMGILYALFVLSLGWLVYNHIHHGIVGLLLFQIGVLISLPLLIECTFIGILLEAWRQHSIDGAISKRLAKIIYWPPRIIGPVVYLLNLAITLGFFFDGLNFWQNLNEFVSTWWSMIIIGVALVFAWRWEWVGTGIFSLIGYFLLLVIPYDLFSMLETLLLASGPLLLLAVDFWINWRWHKEIRAAMRSGPILMEQPAGY